LLQYTYINFCYNIHILTGKHVEFIGKSKIVRNGSYANCIMSHQPKVFC